MKVQEQKIQNSKVIHIYVTEQEKEDAHIQYEIGELKAKNDNVVLFVSGNNAPEKVLKEMVKSMKDNVVDNS